MAFSNLNQKINFCKKACQVNFSQQLAAMLIAKVFTAMSCITTAIQAKLCFVFWPMSHLPKWKDGASVLYCSQPTGGDGDLLATHFAVLISHPSFYTVYDLNIYVAIYKMMPNIAS